MQRPLSATGSVILKSMNNRPTHRVSVKIALLNQGGDRVLMTVLPSGGYGLPGGHIEGFEQPDVALSRELHEELGLAEGAYYDVVQRQFWREDGGDRIILGYTGVFHDAAVIDVDQSEVIDTIWVSYDDIATGVVNSTAYNHYLLEVLSK